MQIRAGVDCAYSPGMVREQLRAARTANGRPYVGANPGVMTATTGGCVSVCRGEHCSSAVKASDTTTPMQIRTGVDHAYSPGMVQNQSHAARTANGRPYTGAKPGVMTATTGGCGLGEYWIRRN